MTGDSKETIIIPVKKLIDFINSVKGTNHTESDYDYVVWEDNKLKVYMKQFVVELHKKKKTVWYILTKSEIASALSVYVGSSITTNDFTTIGENGDNTFLEVS